MISEELQKKIDRAIRLLQAYDDKEHPVEIAYSGGKDSDVILQLAKEANINFRAIYKNTTIDPPGTIKHAKEMGAEVVRPKKTFFQIVEEGGMPTRFRRLCCQKLKEYKILDKCVMGVRRAESVRRKKQYNESEPTECRFYNGRTKNSKDAAEYHVEAIYPILSWTDDDVLQFLTDRKIKCAPVYYDEYGKFHIERRLGCMCCPLMSNKKRIRAFKEHPRMVKAYLRAAKKYIDAHPDSVLATTNENDVYLYFFRNVFVRSTKQFLAFHCSLFGRPDYKAFLEEQFGIDLTI